MYFKTPFALTALCAAITSAITIDEPHGGSELDFSQNTTIKWTTESSDPTSFDINLINEDARVFVTIAHGVDPKKGEFTFHDVNTTATDGYSFRFISFDEHGRTLADSESFSVVPNNDGSHLTSKDESSSSGTRVGLEAPAVLLAGGLAVAQLLAWAL
ncbi:GPI anchored serine-threonine rich family protein [Aspergillus candidus]|uniref:Yeast cell wall synthesis Kre9/Knh1-like N-terminal domain-containing protein n=1 Tax=Aspergillus candidus TaxID=41067 RepID=A0A2I2FFX3_ASPCN|nr:hypothetical protein BDW47DRAFT_103124 [Aspergillus candidus]PLB39489.1 hypothetical protein BDW47DRAFT_103124 [Aspergillus candidus]